MASSYAKTCLLFFDSFRLNVSDSQDPLTWHPRHSLTSTSIIYDLGRNK